MATQEFKETGKTENQRLHQAEQTSQDAGAESFVDKFMVQNPEINDILQPPPQGPDLSDLSQSELLEAYNALQGATHGLTPEDANRLSSAVRELQSG